jgi:SAM-dependent methyltransferase
MRGVMNRLNEFYNRNLEQRVASSIFAVGGIANRRVRKKLSSWIASSRGIFLDVGSGDEKWRAYVPPHCRYIALDYIPAALSCPWRDVRPDICGDGQRLPIRSGSVDVVLNVTVLEHVRDPAAMLREFARVLRPDGLLCLVGPGDILMGHGDPHNYFNMTRHAYRAILGESGMEIVEEFYPRRTWLSIAGIAYAKIVRNDVYNRHPALKLLQMAVLAVSLVVSPFVNVAAVALDAVTPFDGRGYDLYMALARKNAAA